MQVFIHIILSNYEDSIMCVTVLLEYLTDCFIRVSRSCIIVSFFGEGGVVACAPLCIPWIHHCYRYITNKIML